MTVFSKPTEAFLWMLLGSFSTKAVSTSSWVFSLLIGFKAYVHEGLYPLIDAWIVKSWKYFSTKSDMTPTACPKYWVVFDIFSSFCWPQIKLPSESSVPRFYTRVGLNPSGAQHFFVWNETGLSFMLFFGGGGWLFWWWWFFWHW